MKRLLLFLVLATAANAQTQLTVTATNIHGPNGVPYAFGTAHASTNCTGNAQAYIGTTPIPRDTPTVGLDGFAGFSQVLYNTAIMVDVNQNPLVCNYIYHVIDQCGIAAFAASVTGVTGAGPVDLSSQINAVAVNVSPQCGGAGGVSAIYEHNGTVVGQEPRYNFIDSGSVTATFVDNPGANRVDLTLASAGGSGCTLPGHNTAVLSEHPLGTCYNSVNWTWDDGLNKQNMMQGIGNSVSGTFAALSFFIGDDNTATNSGSLAFLLGNDNIAGATTNVSDYFMIGNSNSLTGGNGVYIFGEDNNFSRSSIGNVAIGFSNSTAEAALGGTRHNFLIGDDNFLQANAGAAFNVIRNAYVFGLQNQLINNSTTTGQPMEDIAILGENNTITGTATTNYINGAHIMGSCNTITDTTNIAEEIEIVGEQNSVDGSESTLEILGFQNSAVNVTPSTDNFSTATMVGLNNSINGAPTGTHSLALTVGSGLQVSSCSDCFLFGRNGVTSTSNFLGIGLSATPEIEVPSPAHVTITAWPVSQVIAFTYCAAGCTLTGTPCTTGSSSYNTCTDTINFASIGTFADAGYVAACTGVGPADPGNPGNIGRAVFQGVVSKTASSIGLNTATQGSSAVHFQELDCTLTHR